MHLGDDGVLTKYISCLKLGVGKLDSEPVVKVQYIKGLEREINIVVFLFVFYFFRR